MNCSRNPPKGIPRWLEKEKQRKTYKQTYSFHLSPIKCDLYKTFRKYFCKYPKMIQRKITETSTSILDQQYLSQTKSNFYETFRKSYCGYPKNIKKQTNNLVNWQYLSQIKPDFHKTLSKTPCAKITWFTKGYLPGGPKGPYRDQRPPAKGPRGPIR